MYISCKVQNRRDVRIYFCIKNFCKLLIKHMKTIYTAHETEIINLGETFSVKNIIEVAGSDFNAK